MHTLPGLLGSARASTAPSWPAAAAAGGVGGGDARARSAESPRAKVARPGQQPALWPSPQQSQKRPPLAGAGPQLPPERRRQQPRQQQQQALQPARACSDRPGVQQLMQWIERELEINGLRGAGPSLERVRIFATALNEVIDMLPSYRPILLSVQKEYEALVDRLQLQVSASGPLEGRVRTLAAEGLSLVGESMAWYQLEVSSLRQRLAAAERERDCLRAEQERLAAETEALRGAGEAARQQASDLHTQNLDILRHSERMERQVEKLRATEKDLQGLNGQLKQRARERELRVSTVEEQLKVEREKVLGMVPREECEAVRADLREAEATIREQEYKLAAKQKDYMSLVDTYSKKIGQTLNDCSDARPLTPRPTWRHCKGLLDPEDLHSTDKADATQNLAQQMLTHARTVLCAYGLSAASQKSAVFRQHATHRLSLPLEAVYDPPEDSGEKAPPVKNELSRAADEAWLPPDTDEDTPEALRHPEEVRDLRLSRGRACQAIEGALLLRARHGGNSLSVPFVEFLVDHPPDYVKKEDALEFAINIYATVRRHAAEPDFLAYLLLLKGKISDSVVKENRGLCAELLRIFTAYFEAEDGKKIISKQHFIYGLREVLQNKEKDRFQDLVACLPHGAADLPVSFERLLLDDPYVLSPVVYALRLQHLDETLVLSERLERAVRGCLAEGQTTVRFDAVEAAFKEDAELGALLQAEDYARAFGTSLRALRPQTEQDVERLVGLLKHGEIFRLLFFPALLSEDGGDPALLQGDLR